MSQLSLQLEQIFNIHDPIAETNFKVCEKIHGIIKYFSITKDIPKLTEILKTKNIPGSQQDIERAINFLDLNNLLVNNKEKAHKKSVVSKLVSGYCLGSSKSTQLRNVIMRF